MRKNHSAFGAHAIALAIAFTIATGSARAATDLDKTDFSGSPATTNSPFYSGTGTTYDKNESSTLPNGTITIGSQGKGFDFKLANLTSVAGSTFIVASGAATTGSLGVHAIIGGTTNFAAGGTITLNASPSNADKNSFNTGGFTASGGAVTVNANQYTTFETGVVNDGTLGSATGAFTLNLNGANAGFGTGDVTLASGLINATAGAANKTDNLALNGTLNLNAAAAGGARLAVNGSGTVLNVLQYLTDPGTYSNVSVGANSASGTATGYGTLAVIGGSTLNLGSLTLNQGATLDQNSQGDLNVAASLFVNGNVEDAANLVTTVTGQTTVAGSSLNPGRYLVKGTKNQYKGGMRIQGTLEGDAAATAIQLGADADSLALMEIDGGTVKAGSGGFTVNYADIVVSKGNPNLTLDASSGALDMSTSNLTIALADLAYPVNIDATKTLAVNQYRQTLGDVEIAGNGFTVKGPAVIGDAKATSAVIQTVNGAVTYQSGLTLENYGGLVTTAGATVNLGSGTTPGNLTLMGHNLLAAASGGTGLKLVDRSTGGTGRLAVNGIANRAHGNIDASTLDAHINYSAELNVAGGTLTPATTPGGFQVKSLSVDGLLALGTNQLYDSVPTSLTAGGRIYNTGSQNMFVNAGGAVVADYAAAHLDNQVSAGSSANRLIVGFGGKLTANTATIHADNWSEIDLNGTFTAGIQYGTKTTAAILDSNSPIVIGAYGTISLTGDLAKIVHGSTETAIGTVLMQTSSAEGIISHGDLVSNSMYGSFAYKITPDGKELYVDSAEGQLDHDRETDLPLAIANLRRIWGDRQINDSFGTVVYDVNEGYLVSDGTESGDKNVGLFTALANPESYNVSRNTLEYMNGAYLYGVTDVAIETAVRMGSQLHNRLRSQQCGFLHVPGEPCDECGNIPIHRVWANGFLVKQKSDGRQGFSGYENEGYGASLGLDWIAAPNIVLGLAGSYQQSDYIDSGAYEHNSQIESFTASAYGTLSCDNGFFGTLSGSYTYSVNDLAELRDDPTVFGRSWGESHFRTGTIGVNAAIGKDFHWDNFIITPTIGLTYAGAENSAHDDFLGGIATNRVSDTRNHVLYAPLEIGAQYDCLLSNNAKIRFSGVAGWAYNFRRDGMQGSIGYLGLVPGAGGVGSAGAEVTSQENPGSSYRLGVGAEYNCQNFGIGLKYDLVGKDGYKGHRLMATAGYYF